MTKKGVRSYYQLGYIEYLKGANIHIKGVVQGVGFRPFVYQLATRLSLKGWVRNTSDGVDIEIDAPDQIIEEFIQLIQSERPPLARIDDIQVSYNASHGYDTFSILNSKEISGVFQPISADVSICDDCLRELFEPTNRRYRYPFINCTNCGPRFTIIRDIPYDRPYTSMASFEMCMDCSGEYNNPMDRRFHAQPIACAHCGPEVWFETLQGDKVGQGEDAIQLARYWISEGKIVALKGLGGFHLTCDATNQQAVTRLRERKLRVDKPFALMFFSEQEALSFCELDKASMQLLRSKERPIVLVKRKMDAKIVEAVSPQQDNLGIMLPYTPLHYLLLARQIGFPLALVMTSGNLSEEPIAIENQQAREQLGQIADGFLFHNREISTRCDDSVVSVVRQKSYFLRRARGYAPLSISLPFKVGPIFAAGAELKNTFCLTKDNYVFMSQHIGNLENYETFKAYEEAVSHFEKLFRITPKLLAHDLHPDYLATRFTLARAEENDVPIVGIQHHHAHIAACMVEHQFAAGEQVIGVAFDGSGYGEDGAIWGGEFLLVDYYQYKRLYYLSYTQLPGGETAIYQPWRTALAWLRKAGINWDDDLAPLQYLLKDELGHRQVGLIRKQLEKNINTPLTSSMGRLFDAVASLLGIRHVVNYEAQAAIEMEKLASPYMDEDETAYPFALYNKVIDASPILVELIKDYRKGIPIANLAYNFHLSIAKMVAEICDRIRTDFGIKQVVLSGGVWQNLLLLDAVLMNLEKMGFEVMYHQLVPTNDGGIALGQAVIAAHQNSG